MDLPRGWDEDLWLAVPGGRSFSVWSDSASGAPVLGGVGVLLQSAGVLVWFVPVLCGWAWGCAAVGGRASGWTLGRSGSGGGLGPARRGPRGGGLRFGASFPGLGRPGLGAHLNLFFSVISQRRPILCRKYRYFVCRSPP